jgi:F-type H+-transporting ATPase subunit delta
MKDKSGKSTIEVYAQALFQESEKLNITKAFSEDIEVALKTLMDNKKFCVFIEAPHICTTEKHTIIDKIMKGRFNQLLLNLFHIIVNKDHSQLLGQILISYLDKVDRSHNILQGQIISSVELKPSEKDDLQKYLEKKVGKKLHLRFKINPDIVGGIIFRCEDMMIDQSIHGQLHKLKDQLELKLNLKHI